MKKLVLLVVMVLFTTGCENINSLSLDEVVTIATEDKMEIYNQHRQGYKYYIPKGMRIVDYSEYNEVLTDSNYTYYLFIEVVGFINKTITDYEINDDVFYSNTIDFHDKFGYIEVELLENEKYLVEIIYNYAKMEVIVDKVDVNVAIFNSLNILSSIYYNEVMLSSLVGENVFNYKETEFKIYEPENDSNFLYYSEQTDDLIEDDYDSDLIK